MANAIVISDRRSDAQHAAFAIADRLRRAFGQDDAFLGRGEVEGGDDWSESIRGALAAARTVLVVIGPSWLRCADDCDRRRPNDPEDCVGREICQTQVREGQQQSMVISV